MSADVRAPVRASRDAHRASCPPLRILLVEGQAIDGKPTLRLLQRKGCRADVAIDDIEAMFASVECRTCEVILMDGETPELHERDAVRRIASRRAVDDRPRVIAMTAGGLRIDRDERSGAGEDKPLHGPIRIDARGDAGRGARTRGMA